MHQEGRAGVSAFDTAGVRLWRAFSYGGCPAVAGVRLWRLSGCGGWSAVARMEAGRAMTRL
ncbi:MAG TPA: hypothetical protein VL978_18520 [Puia sp.]|nr:hypothetical protein [Puia sp.]